MQSLFMGQCHNLSEKVERPSVVRRPSAESTSKTVSPPRGSGRLSRPNAKIRSGPANSCRLAKRLYGSRRHFHVNRRLRTVRRGTADGYSLPVRMKAQTSPIRSPLHATHFSMLYRRIFKIHRIPSEATFGAKCETHISAILIYSAQWTLSAP